MLVYLADYLSQCFPVPDATRHPGCIDGPAYFVCGGPGNDSPSRALSDRPARAQ